MVISKQRILFCLLYVIIGVYIFNVDISAGILYITVFPLFIIMFVNNCKNGNIVFSMIFLFLLLSKGVTSFLFFIEKDNYSKIGWSAIGSFGFTLGEFAKVYIYVLIFTLVLYIFSKISSDSIHDNVGLKYVSNVFDKSLNLLKKKSKYQRYVLIISFSGIILSIYMYSNQIGLVGMKPKSLPFHMTGILFYTRRYIVNVLLIYFYIKSKNKNQSLVFICIYVFFAGIASISRSICGILLIPIAAEAIISKKYSRATIIIVYFAVIYEVVSELRNYVYSAAYIKYSYKELVDFALQMLCGIDGDWLVSFVSGICTRLGGWQGEILGSQYHGCTITDLLHYFLGEGQGQVIPNMTENLYGFSMPSDKSFGIGIGFFGVVISASSGNYVFIIISGIVVGMLFFVQEKVIRKEMLANSGYVKVLFMIGMSALSIFSIFVNGSTKMFYISTVVILIVHYLVKIKSK